MSETRRKRCDGCGKLLTTSDMILGRCTRDECDATFETRKYEEVILRANK